MSEVPEKCDRCSKDPKFHDVKILPDGTIVEKHACEDCAAEMGFLPLGASDLVSPSRPAQPGAACPDCHLTFAQFKRIGRLGCPTCYETFERQLAPILERSQEGGTHHVGKVPRRLLRERSQAGSSGDLASVLGDAKQRALRLKTLSERLTRAVEHEQYEQAARIRDQIRLASLQPGQSQSAPETSTDPAAEQEPPNEREP